jgi:hypothetical protein
VSAPEAIPEAAASEARRPWALYGIIAAVVVTAVLLGIIGVRTLTARPAIALGETPAAALALGSCLAEPGVDLETYTVVNCGTGHPQQVIGAVDLEAESDTYSTFEAVGIFAQAVCDRYLDYGLFVASGVAPDDYDVDVIAMPSEAEFTTGRTTALCSITSSDGTALTSDLYAPLP